VINQHPERGRELLNEFGGFDESVRRLVLDHHERLDGGGYPRGIDAQDLDLPTRILAVCDVYDALVSRRAYRPAWSREEALVAALECIVSPRAAPVAEVVLTSASPAPSAP
jgi:HD-GYP domain-containing protein (c-di-GMP phosphodiesterase class II)